MNINKNDCRFLATKCLENELIDGTFFSGIELTDGESVVRFERPYSVSIDGFGGFGVSNNTGKHYFKFSNFALSESEVLATLIDCQCCAGQDGGDTPNPFEVSEDANFDLSVTGGGKMNNIYIDKERRKGATDTTGNSIILDAFVPHYAWVVPKITTTSSVAGRIGYQSQPFDSIDAAYSALKSEYGKISVHIVVRQGTYMVDLSNGASGSIVGTLPNFANYDMDTSQPYCKNIVNQKIDYSNVQYDYKSQEYSNVIFDFEVDAVVILRQNPGNDYGNYFDENCVVKGYGRFYAYTDKDPFEEAFCGIVKFGLQDFEADTVFIDNNSFFIKEEAAQYAQYSLKIKNIFAAGLFGIITNANSKFLLKSENCHTVKGVRFYDSQNSKIFIDIAKHYGEGFAFDANTNCELTINVNQSACINMFLLTGSNANCEIILNVKSLICNNQEAAATVLLGTGYDANNNASSNINCSFIFNIAFLRHFGGGGYKTLYLCGATNIDDRKSSIIIKNGIWLSESSNFDLLSNGFTKYIAPVVLKNMTFIFKEIGSIEHYSDILTHSVMTNVPIVLPNPSNSFLGQAPFYDINILPVY